MFRLFRAIADVRRIIRSRKFAVAALSAVTMVVVLTVSSMTKAVYIRDGDQLTIDLTLKNNVEDILEENDVVLAEGDEVSFTGFDGRQGEISIARAFSVTVTADKQTQEIKVTDGTVLDVLDKANIILGEEDIVNKNPMSMLCAGDKIVVTRIGSHKVIKYEEIPFETNTRVTPLLRSGRQRVLTEGQNGSKRCTYLYHTTDGEVTEIELIGEEMLKQTVTKEVIVGGDVAVSVLDFGIQLDALGQPVSYKKVYRNQVCTGYSAGRGAWGASGMSLYPGYVAVDPSEIPYGTKMYIVSPDGKFTYGCAIAADTGTGLLQGIIDIDLYYQTYVESALNGRKYLNVYILE